MVAAFLLTAAFAAANLAYLAFNPDSFAFEIAAFALGVSSPGIMNYAARTITSCLQPTGNASSILHVVENSLSYYKYNPLELSIGFFSDSLVPHTTRFGIAITVHSAPHPVHRPSSTPTAFVGQGAPSTGEYSDNLSPSSFGHSFTRGLPYSLPTPQNGVCPSDGSSSLNRIASEYCERDTRFVNEESRTSGPQIYSPPAQVGYLDDTCRSPQPHSGYRAAATQLGAPAPGFDTRPARNRLFRSWTVHDRHYLSFGVAEYASGYELPLRPTKPEYADNTHPLLGPRLTQASAGYLDATFTPPPLLSRHHVTPGSSHLLGTTILRNDTCISDDRPATNWAVCDRHNSNIDPFESAVYVSAPELFLRPAQLANVDGTWAILGVPDLCNHGTSFNWRIGVLAMVVLFFGARVYRYLFLSRPMEEAKSLPYTLPSVPTHWIFYGESVGDEEQPKESWVIQISSHLYTTPYVSGEATQDDVSEIELGIPSDSNDSLDAHTSPLDPADVPLPDDADNGLLPDPTDPSPTSSAVEHFPHSNDKNAGAAAHCPLYAHTPGDIIAPDSGMSLASLHGGISVRCDDHLDAGADDSTNLNTNDFIFTFTPGTDGCSLIAPIDYGLRKIPGGVCEESKNVTLRSRKRRRVVKEPASATDDTPNQSSESTNPTLDANRIDLQPAFSSSVDTSSQDNTLLDNSGSIPLYWKVFAFPSLARRSGLYTIHEAGDQVGEDGEVLKSSLSDSTIVPSGLDSGEDKPRERRDKKAARTQKRLRRLSIVGTVPPNPSKLDSPGCIPLYHKVFPFPSLARRSGLYTIHEGDQDEDILESSLGDLTIVSSDLDSGEDEPLERRDKKAARAQKRLRRLSIVGIVPPNSSKLDSSGHIPLLDSGEDKPMKRRQDKKAARTQRLPRRLSSFGIVPPNSSELDSSGSIPLYWKVFSFPSLAGHSGFYTIHEEGDQNEDTLESSLSDLSTVPSDLDLDLGDSLAETAADNKPGMGGHGFVAAPRSVKRAWR